MSNAPRIRTGFIGAGWADRVQIPIFRQAGLAVQAIAAAHPEKAQAVAARHQIPEVHADWRTLVESPSVDLVSICAPPALHLEMVEAALRAGKHVLSQKPFVLDLAEGQRLVDLARAQGVKLAVNQNGRWAPHLAWMREAVRAGVIGEVISVHASIHWNHGWIAGTPFEKIEDLILYDFGIHWFDFLHSIVGARAHAIVATAASASGQMAAAPLLAQVLVQMEGGQASLVFDGATA